MKKLKYIIPLLSLLILFSCKDDNGTDPVDDQTTASSYYPGGVGTTLSYAIDTVNASTQNYEQFGSRNSTFESASGDYLLQRNNNDFGGAQFTSSALFRRTDAGVYFQVDTSGFTGIADSLSESIGVSIDINSDEEINILSAPLFEGKTWKAFEINISFTQVISITVPVIEVNAAYEGSEEMFVRARNENLTVQKIKYTLNIIDEEALNIGNINNPPTEVYTANAWFAAGTGLVKVEGNSVVLDAIRGTTADLDFSNTQVRESLVSVDLQ